jgi:hypothetical protein
VSTWLRRTDRRKKRLAEAYKPRLVTKKKLNSKGFELYVKRKIHIINRVRGWCVNFNVINLWCSKKSKSFNCPL